ncbi:MAG TPA: hypothetical protein VI318_02410 [Baekduia sp.]
MAILGGLALVSSVALGVLMWTYRDAKGSALTVARIKPRDTEVLSYIAGYLIPFFNLDLSHRDDVVTLVGFLLVLCVIYVNSSLLLVNPLLSFVGFRVWEVVDVDDHEYLLVSRRAPAPRQVIEPMKVGDYLRVQV